jgi:tetratricopeptide (TPR) repeat protein
VRRIESPEEFAQAIAELRAQIGAGDAEAAIAWASQVEGNELLCAQVAAITLTEGGHALRSVGVLERAVELWEALGAELGEEKVAYNQGNAELNLFETAAIQDGVAQAMSERMAVLQAARAHYLLAAEGSPRSPDEQVQAWTNLGNSYDHLGRDLEAIEAYRRALAIDPGFGMARGNLGLALVHVAPFARQHAASVGGEGLAELQAALTDEERVREIGGMSAFEHFRAELEKYTSRGAQPVRVSPPAFTEPYLRWMGEQRLFLHVSPSCLQEDSLAFDPLFFQFVRSGWDEGEDARAKRLIDAYNALKQSYVASRYQTWLALEEESPAAKHLGQLERESPYLDTLLFSRFGTRTGMLIHAFTAAMNLLDQVAVFVHLYLRTGRSPREVTMRRLWLEPKTDAFDASLRSVIDRGNRGLLGLCDLAGDLAAKGSRLAELTELRHAATHRLLVTHWSPTDPDASPWLERIGFSELAEAALEQLRISRSALFYLARLVDIEEHRAAAADIAQRASIPFPLTASESDLPGY